MENCCGFKFIQKYLFFIPRYKACCYHDKRYELSKIKDKETRYKIDRIFYHQLLIEKPNKKITAKIYYYLVRIFGWITFYK